MMHAKLLMALFLSIAATTGCSLFAPTDEELFGNRAAGSAGAGSSMAPSTLSTGGSRAR